MFNFFTHMYVFSVFVCDQMFYLLWFYSGVFYALLLCTLSPFCAIAYRCVIPAG
jgi:hypothetical protein